MISVIIPHYNQEAFLSEAIESVQKQTLQPDEIIVIDDNSTLMKPRVPLDSKIRVIYRDENGGIGAVRQQGLEEAKGDWIAYLSADDSWEPEFLEKCMKAAKQYKVKAVYTNYFRINENGKRIQYFEEAHFVDPVDMIIHAWKRCNVMFSGLLFHKDISDKIDGFEPNLRYGEDYLFLLKALKHFRFAHIEEFLANYRIHKLQTTEIEAVNIPDNDIKIKDMARRYYNGDT